MAKAVFSRTAIADWTIAPFGRLEVSSCPPLAARMEDVKIYDVGSRALLKLQIEPNKAGGL